MKTHYLSNRQWLAVTCLSFASLSAQAQIINGGFEFGLSGWTTFGDVSTQANTAAGSGAGAAKLFLTTAGLEADEFDSAGVLIGPFNASRISAVVVGSAGGLETLNGNAIGAFDAFGLFAYEGSLARQSFSAQAGDILSFVWNFGTRDTGLDHAFVVIDGVVTSLSGSSRPTQMGSGFDLLQTGFRSFSTTFSTTFSTSGTHSLAFGVVDLNDSAVRSSLSVDQVQISAVPEPSSGALTLLGLALTGFFVRRLKP